MKSLRHIWPPVATLTVALPLVACPPVYGQDSSTAVHAAETTASSLEGLMLEGKTIYETHCGACH